MFVGCAAVVVHAGSRLVLVKRSGSGRRFVGAATMVVAPGEVFDFVGKRAGTNQCCPEPEQHIFCGPLEHEAWS